MPPQLVALTEGPDLLLDKPILLLGRHQECDIQLNSRKISRRHCCIAQVNNELVVRDLCSTNGIRINGTRVLEGQLKEGDQLTIGNYHYRVRWEDRPEAVAGGRPTDRPASPPAPAAEPDPMLSLDVPVPLAEPGGRPGPPSPQPRPEKRDTAEPPSPRIIPDDLDLASLGEMAPAPEPKPSGSSHS